MNLILNKVPTSNFKPSKIPGLVLWLDSSSLSSLSDSTPIDTWSDLSGQGNHATQGTAVNKPTKETVTNNGKTFAVARFDGVGDYLGVIDNNSLDMTSALTVIAVISPSSSGSGSYRTVIAKRPSSGDANYELYLGNDPGVNQGRLAWWSGATENAISGYIPTVGAWTEIAATITDASNVTIYANGVSVHTGATTTIVANGGGLGIGRAGDFPAEYYVGDISHVLIYNRALSTSERQRIERWLSKKTGVTLA